MAAAQVSGPSEERNGQRHCFRNRVVLVTGGASGIGWGIVQAFGRTGATVVVTDANEQLLKKQMAEYDKSGWTGHGFAMDVVDAQRVRSVIDSVETDIGAIDVLVNNAAIFSDATLLEITDDEWDNVQAVNVKGVLHSSQAVATHMASRGRGTIVNVASLAGKRARTIFCKPGESTWSAYAVSKAAVAALTLSMAYEWIPMGIRVNAVSPGPILTGKYDEQKLTRSGDVPVGRIGTVLDVAAAVLFLASDESSFVVGEILDVNGGIVMD